MFEVIGKGTYQVKFNDKVYDKVRYTLKLKGDKVKGFSAIEGVMCETVCLPQREDTLKPKLGDSVVVSYDVYNGVKKPNGIFII